MKMSLSISSLEEETKSLGCPVRLFLYNFSRIVDSFSLSYKQVT